jgi:hypothetical protein
MRGRVVLLCALGRQPSERPLNLVGCRLRRCQILDNLKNLVRGVDNPKHGAAALDDLGDQGAALHVSVKRLQLVKASQFEREGVLLVLSSIADADQQSMASLI